MIEYSHVGKVIGLSPEDVLNITLASDNDYKESDGLVRKEIYSIRKRLVELVSKYN